jgi:2-acylglycerol O-acyltransferase 2/2-acylglycerol O-acyltransferase 1
MDLKETGIVSETPNPIDDLNHTEREPKEIKNVTKDIINNDSQHSSKKYKKKISPLNLPVINRIQTVFILLHSTSILWLCSLYFLLWCIPYAWPFMIYYTIFYYILDRSPVNGGVWYKRSEKFRNLDCWKFLTGYFPIKFHKMTTLKPTFECQRTDNNNNNNNNILTLDNKRIGPSYIFGYHPHGIIATGVSSGFTNESTGWNHLFPGIKCFVTTLVNQFQIPFYRDYLMALGVTTVVKRNLKLLLNKGGSVVIVVGGARESLMAKPGLNSIVLNKRKGFIKLALESLDKNGVCVVPVYGFGENDIYDVFFTDDLKSINETEGEFELQNSNHNTNIVVKNIINKIKKFIYKCQMLLKNKCGWTLPIVISRGIFNYDFGILPYRRSINVVFGKPIEIKRLNGLKLSDPIIQEEIDYWHEKYMNGLQEVWEWGHPKFSNPSDEILKIVE